jgi:hypothetical protein
MVFPSILSRIRRTSRLANHQIFFDPLGQKNVRDALLVLGTTIPDTKRMFGSRSEVDPIRHLIGSAILWGGLSEKDALYLNIRPDNTDGAAVYKLNVLDVPVAVQFGGCDGTIPNCLQTMPGEIIWCGSIALAPKR